MKSQEAALAAATAADDKKGQNIAILDIAQLTPMADYFVLCTANSSAQVEAISKAVREKLENVGFRCRTVEGLSQSRWVLMDFGDVVVHIFRKEERDFYNLERLWGDAAKVPFPAQ